MKKLIKGVILTVSISLVSACAANMPGRGHNTDNDTFGLLSDQRVNTEHFDRMQGKMKGFIKELNLSEEQKKQFNEIKHSVRNQFNKNKSKREELKNIFKESFLSDKIDKEALKNKLSAIKPQNDERLDLIANNIVKAYNILTPEQRDKVESRLNQIEKKVGNFSNNPLIKKFHNPEKRVEMMAKALNLSDSQKENLKSLFQNGVPDRKEQFDKIKNIRASVQTELKTGNPNAEKIKSIIKGARDGMEANMDKHLDKLIKVHDILTPEQRTKLVEKLEKRMSKVHKKMKQNFHKSEE